MLILVLCMLDSIQHAEFLGPITTCKLVKESL